MADFLTQFLESGTIFTKDDSHLFIGYGKKTWSKNPSSTSPSWYFPDFFLSNERPWYTHQFWQIIAKKDLHQWLPEKSCKTSFLWENRQSEIFNHSLQRLQIVIRERELQKAVPYLFEFCSFAPDKSLIQHMLKASLRATEIAPLHIYGFWDEKEGILGATPEILFSSQEKQLRTMACAGTLLGEANDEEQAKLLKEHRYVIDGVVNAIESFGNELLVGNTQWQNFQQLKHLVTPIEMTLHHSIPFENLVEALHPTAAIGTFPKENGWNWLHKFDQLIPRKRFGAPCACLFQEKALCLVAIRNVQWDTTEMRIGAGCGIIAESNLEKEKKEIEVKLTAIREILHL